MVSMKKLGPWKNRWGGLCGPSTWQCMNNECAHRRVEVQRSFAATYGSCSECGHSLYRVRTPQGDQK